jgi:hypothetical protein
MRWLVLTSAEESFSSDHRIFTLLYRKLGYAYLGVGQYAKALLNCEAISPDFDFSVDRRCFND